jgi:hypothetical protein
VGQQSGPGAVPGGVGGQEHQMGVRLGGVGGAHRGGQDVPPVLVWPERCGRRLVESLIVGVPLLGLVGPDVQPQRNPGRGFRRVARAGDADRAAGVGVIEEGGEEPGMALGPLGRVGEQPTADRVVLERRAHQDGQGR